MNASTRSTVASLGERPRRKSPQNFRSPIARSPNSDGVSLRAPKEFRDPLLELLRQALHTNAPNNLLVNYARQ